MKKNIFKRLFIKFSKLLGFEIIDQNEFSSPTLNKELNENLSNICAKSAKKHQKRRPGVVLGTFGIALGSIWASRRPKA